jgi:hypothetical protein
MTDNSLLFPNARPAVAPASSSGPLCTLLIDAEEDFDWSRPLHGMPYDVDCMRNLSDLQTIAGAYGAIPTYLLTYPVLMDAAIVADLRRRMSRGQCLAGIQLHPWVTPPFTEAADIRNSFATNLGPALEEAKLIQLIEMFRSCFGADPLIFRSGRYGLSPYTPALLEKHGLLIDTSLAPNTSTTSEEGPDFSAEDYHIFWFGGTDRLLELPLCRGIVGWGGKTAERLYRRFAVTPFALRGAHHSFTRR